MWKQIAIVALAGLSFMACEGDNILADSESTYNPDEKYEGNEDLNPSDQPVVLPEVSSETDASSDDEITLPLSSADDIIVPLSSANSYPISSDSVNCYITLPGVGSQCGLLDETSCTAQGGTVSTECPSGEDEICNIGGQSLYIYDYFMTCAELEAMM